MKLAQLGEFGLIERIRHRVVDGGDLLLGIGDDCAAAELPPGQQLLTTTDMLLEDVHFRRAWTDWRTLGRKSVAVNVSDIAAMGGEPRHLFVGLGIPRDITVEDLDALSDGLLEAAQRYGATLAGGDTCGSRGGLVISVTLQGTVPAGCLIPRSGARAGDLICVTGTLGDSALGLRQLMAGERPDPWLAQRHLDPQARLELGRALAQEQLATAMIDVSDGVCADLGHILHCSGVGARLELESLPLSEPFRACCGRDPALLDLALGGGEDYELLFTLDEENWPRVQELSRKLDTPVCSIGRIGSGEGMRVVTASGRDYPTKSAGFNHFGPADGKKRHGRG